MHTRRRRAFDHLITYTVDVQDDNTALMLATKNIEEPTLVQLLLDHKANPNHQTKVCARAWIVRLCEGR